MVCRSSLIIVVIFVAQREEQREVDEEEQHLTKNYPPFLSLSAEAPGEASLFSPGRSAIVLLFSHSLNLDSRPIERSFRGGRVVSA